MSSFVLQSSKVLETTVGMYGGKVTYRVRIPVRTRRMKPRPHMRRGRTRKSLNGGFLPLLAPIIAAAVGAIPGIASVALQASRNK
ncbi:pX [Equine adenovirus 2]|uniref:PX n=1 Tax=Equine adenovirus B serotype 2 TaxID=67603 RepID=A0A0K1DBU2_ADEE2|nr:pX [Equine adenovirus 2]AKT26030.1 pX [Equine adenovirus 2]